jgi:hypothetical protein
MDLTITGSWASLGFAATFGADALSRLTSGKIAQGRRQTMSYSDAGTPEDFPEECSYATRIDYT